jgi:lipoate-protein ligase A
MTEEFDPAAAMERDVDMLRAADQGTPGLRIYRWRATCVTLGRFQHPAAADITLSVAAPRDGREGVKALYRRLTREPIALLGRSGIEAFLAEDLPGAVQGSSASTYCFASASRLDIVDVRGRKICGCALRVTRRAALLQTSIPVTNPTIHPGSLLRGGHPPEVVVLNLDTLLLAK